MKKPKQDSDSEEQPVFSLSSSSGSSSRKSFEEERARESAARDAEVALAVAAAETFTPAGVVRPRPLAIDLFAGAGGMSLGFKDAGFQVVQAVDADRHAAATYRKNHPGTDVLEADIATLDPGACLKRLGLRPGDLTALIGGPPCQGFSESNRRTRMLDNPENHLYRHFLRFVDAMRPVWVVIENVSGIRTLAHGAILDTVVSECEARGYRMRWQELNGADYGLPQRRRRVFLVGNCRGLPTTFPDPTHGPGLKPYVTVGEAISDLPALEAGAADDYLPYRPDVVNLSDYQLGLRLPTNGREVVQGNFVSANSFLVLERYRHIEPGANWEAIPAGLMESYRDPSRCHTGIYHRLDPGKPAKVIGNFRKNMLIHPSQHRGLSVREAARLQSFHDGYVFVGSIGFQQQQVGNAVPPLLARAIAKEILRSQSSADPFGRARSRKNSSGG